MAAWNIWANMHWILQFLVATRTWSRNTQPARQIIATVEIVACTDPWPNRAWPRDTRPVPVISDFFALRPHRLQNWFTIAHWLISWFVFLGGRPGRDQVIAVTRVLPTTSLQFCRSSVSALPPSRDCCFAWWVTKTHAPIAHLDRATCWGVHRAEP